MKINEELNKILVAAYSDAKLKKHKYITPEHILYSLLFFEEGTQYMEQCGFDNGVLKEELSKFLEEEMENGHEGEPIQTFGTNTVFNAAAVQVTNSDREVIEVKDIVIAIYDLEESYASYFLKKQEISRLDILKCRGTQSDTNEKKDDIEETIEEKTQEKKGIIKEYATCLNDLYRAGKIPNVIHREEEIKRTIQVLLRKKKNNPIHVGESGVGKTSIVYGIVKMIEEKEVSGGFEKGKIFSLDMGSLLAGTKYRGDFEERLKKLFKEISKYENPIVYIDDIHTIIGAGAISGGSLDATSLIARYLEEGHIKFIGTTTFSEYNKHVSKNSTLSRRFQKIDVKEPSKETTLEILMGIREEYEGFHNVTYSKEALENIIEISERYVRDKKFPDKAIDLMDEIGSRIKMDALSVMERIKNLEEDDNSGVHDFEFEELQESKNDKYEYSSVIVDDKLSKELISEILEIPQENVEECEIHKLRELKNKLQTKIFGQDKALESVVEAIKRSYAGINDEDKPLGSFLFVGPTGVGKTELAKQLAKTLEMNFQRFDMSEYGEKHSIARLIGAPPGYVGYEEGGLLTDKIRNSPRSVVLLDEIEKAHGDIYNILLQVMDYGTLTDSSGVETDFRNSIIIMTSNAGAKDMGRDRIGFGERIILEEAVDDELKKCFSPEFLNRLDDTIVFNHLGKEEVRSVILKIFTQLNDKMKKKSRRVHISEEVIEYIILKSYSRKYGAREVFRYIDKNIKSIIVDKILFDEGEGEINIDMVDGVLKVV